MAQQSPGFVETWSAAQRAYNASHFPSTPLPSSYQAVIRISEAVLSVTYAAMFLGMGLTMSTGIWAPWAINAQRRSAEKRFAPLKGEIN